METCPDCSTPIPEDAPLGLCPVCLVSPPAEEGHSLPNTAPDGLIPGYTIIRQIGEGGFATVYEALQIEPVRRRVALKILKPNVSSPQVLARFDAERQALALMDHPGVASIYDAGETAGGYPWFAMEFVEGGTITRFAAERNLSIHDRIGILCGICEAVQHAHLKGILHRDVKPSNILVSEIDGRPVPKVIDFGIARALDVSLTDQVLFTELHQIIGTPGYMSPEQAALDNTPIDGRSDIYGLGILIFETLTGKQPFALKNGHSDSIPELLRRVIDEEPPLLSRFDPDLRGEIEWVVSKAIAKDPEDRYDSAGSLARELERVLENRPVHAAAPSQWYRVRKFIQRNRISVLAGALALIALLAGATISTFQYVKATQLSENLQLREDDLRNEFRNSDFKMGLQLAARRKTGDAIAHFCRALRTDPEHHATASCLLALLANQKFIKESHPPIPYPDDIEKVRFPLVFESGPYLVSLIDEPEQLAKWAPETGSVSKHPTGFEEPVNHLVALPSGSRFAIATNHAIEIRSADILTSPIFRFEMESSITILTSSRTTNILACGTSDGRVTLLNAETGEAIAERAVSESTISALALAHDNRYIGYGTEAGEAGIWRLGMDLHFATENSHSSAVTALAIPESGSHLASGDREGITYLWESRRMTQLAGPIYHGDAVRVLSVNSAHQKLMSASDDGYARLWNMSDGTLTPPAQPHRGPVTFATQTSSATEFITGGTNGTLRIWSILDGSGESFPNAAQTSAAAVSPDRKYLAVFSDLRRRGALFEIDRDPAWPYRLNPGDETDHSDSFGPVLPQELSTVNGKIHVRLSSGTMLEATNTTGQEHSMRTQQPISSWTLRPEGSQLAALTKGGKLMIWDPDSGEELSPPIRLTGANITGIRFGDSDRQIELLLQDGELAKFEIPPSEPTLPPSFLVFAEKIGGKKLTEEGELKNVTNDSFLAISKDRHTFTSSNEASHQVAEQYANWLLSDRTQRTPGPGQKIEVSQYIESLLNTGKANLIKESLRLDPGNQRAIEMLKNIGRRSRPNPPE